MDSAVCPYTSGMQAMSKGEDAAGHPTVNSMDSAVMNCDPEWQWYCCWETCTFSDGPLGFSLRLGSFSLRVILGISVVAHNVVITGADDTGTSWVQVWVLTVALLIQLPADVRKITVTVVHVGNLNGVPGSWPRPGPAVLCGCLQSELLDGRCLCLSLSLCNCTFQINKHKPLNNVLIM